MTSQQVSEFLKLEQNRINELQREIVIICPANHNFKNREIQVINPQKIIGFCARKCYSDNMTWYDYLGSFGIEKLFQYSHSDNINEIYNSIINYLTVRSFEITMDLPRVLKYNDKYIIEEGMHRLVVAKALGLTEYKVEVLLN